MEALAMAATCYSPLHKYIDDVAYSKEPSYSTTSPLDILHKIHHDTRLDGLFDKKGPDNIESLFHSHEYIVLEYWNAWVITDPNKQFEESQEAAVALLLKTIEPGTHAYDFFLVHLLTSSHAIRILLPLIPKKFHISLVRQWWLLTISVYIAQLRPNIHDDLDEKPTKQWNYIERMAISGPWCKDAHYVKGKKHPLVLKEAFANSMLSSKGYSGSRVYMGRCP